MNETQEALIHLEEAKRTLKCPNLQWRILKTKTLPVEYRNPLYPSRKLYRLADLEQLKKMKFAKYKKSKLYTRESKLQRKLEKEQQLNQNNHVD